MNSREGRVVGIEDGCIVVRIACGDGGRQHRLACVPQQVLPNAAVGQIVAIPLADWELDRRAGLVCLPPLAALAGAFVWPLFGGLAAFGAIGGALIGGLLIRWLVAREPACTTAAQTRTAAEPMAR
jgi:hypothetical protein